MTPAADPHRNPAPPLGATTVVFDGHGFCAGTQDRVEVMAAPHMHSQFELNIVLSGAMTYRFDTRTIAVGEGGIVLFWGMIPHQTVEREEGTRFACFYLPSSLMMHGGLSDGFRRALFGGAFIGARSVLPYDAQQAVSWRRDLLSHDPMLEDIVRDEVSARLRRIDRDGWLDLRETAGSTPISVRPDGARLAAVEAMARFIDEHAALEIDVADVAASARLHPNYAMALFRRGTGQTIVDYITRRRLDTAQALLVSTDEPVATIAFRAGFGSLSRFYDAFGQRFSLSPRRFRAQHRPR